MKIAWFTPFNKKSAIGKYSKLAANCFSEEYEIDIWTCHKENLWETENNIVIFDIHNDILLNQLNQYDMIIYNMGNYLPFHLEIYEVSKKFPGIVILHDFVMHHFFTGYYFANKNDPSQYIDAMEELYGDEAKLLAIQSIQGNNTPIWDSNDVIQFPFINKLVENAIGVVTHSHFHRKKVAEIYSGPISTINFPFKFSTSSSDIESGKLVKILTVGHVNPNKRIDKVIEAIGQDDFIKRNIQYKIIGPYDNNGIYFSNIRDIIEKYNLEEQVEFLGYETEENLSSHMQTSDIYINLRYPAFEGASWSLLEEASNGKPILVTDTGFYSEFPDDTLLKINHQNEIEEIKQNLRELINSKTLRETTGQKTKQYVSENFTEKNYEYNFSQLIGAIQSQKVMISFLDRIGNELLNWDLTKDSMLIRKLTDEIFTIFK